MSTLTALPSSYRDNDGFVFKQDNQYYRLIKPSYFLHYELLMKSGLYKALTDAGRLIQHDEMNATSFQQNKDCKIILPEQIPFISYPYEWSFGEAFDERVLAGFARVFHRQKHRAFRKLDPHPQRDR